MTDEVIERDDIRDRKVVDLVALRTRDRYEGSLFEFVQDAWTWIDSSEFKTCWAIEAFCDHLELVTLGYIKRLLANYPPRCAKTNIVSVCWPAWTWARSEIGFTSGPQVRFLCASYNDRLSLLAANKTRRLILSPFYQRFWGSRFALQWDQNTKTQFDNTAGGSRIATSVRGGLLGLGGDVVNVDDPHNTETEKVIESDADRNRVASWSQELFSTRLNDPKKSAIVLTMQRLHEGDLSGVVLDEMEKGGEDWVHLMIPMRYDEARHCVTVKLPQYEGKPLWEDPRIIDAEETGHDGQLMWEERFGEAEVQNLEHRLGPYMCTPAESPVLMGDLSLRPIGDVKAGDEVIGFTTDTEGGSKRRHLKKTKVKAVTIIKAPVVKMLLSSGHTIRCTPDHRWYMGKRGGSRGKNDKRPLYRPAKVGTELMRVCPQSLPMLNYREQRSAGWLSGFFDGEGSVSLCAKNGPQFRKSSTIRFYQGAGRNLPLCDLLEHHLTHFGFDFTYREFVRGDRKVDKSNHKNRVYSLVGPSGVPLFQKFLHIAQPHKWQDRIIQGALGTKWITDKETVVSIEPDGVEQVYALETETGNYVVWGIASANSAGRLQQAPTPKGGGILMRDWWRVWDEREAAAYGLTFSPSPTGLKEFPQMELVWGSLDTAFKEKEENDFSALTIWGLWLDKTRTPRVMLMYGWAKRLRLHGTIIERKPGEALVNFKQRQQAAWGLVEHIADSMKRYKATRLLIEDKARGYDVAMEINRLYARDKWDVQLLEPVGDKVSRGHSVVPCFTDGAVWAPYINGQPVSWAEPVIKNCEVFPKAVHDDLYDTVTQSLNWARNNGLILRGDEVSAALDEEAAYKPKQQSVAESYGI